MSTKQPEGEPVEVIHGAERLETFNAATGDCRTLTLYNTLLPLRCVQMWTKHCQNQTCSIFNQKPAASITEEQFSTWKTYWAYLGEELNLNKLNEDFDDNSAPYQLFSIILTWKDEA